MNLSKRSLLLGMGACGSIATIGRPALSQPSQDLSLHLQDGSFHLRPEGPETDGLRYDAMEPLPVIHAPQGQPVRLRLRNGLSKSTSLQVCGMRGEGRLDDALAPGLAVQAGAEATLTLAPIEGCTAWFRPRLDASGQAVRGAAGVLMVDPPGAPVVDHDVVLFLRDWRLDAGNHLATADGSRSGTEVVVTAGHRPLPSDMTMQPGARVRLRLVNGSTDRVMVVACQGAKPMIVAIDGQPSELFQPVRDTIPIGPGARFEVLADLPREPGQSVRFVLRGTEPVEGGGPEPDRLLAVLRTDGRPLEARPPIASLPANPALPAMIPLEASKRADLTFASTDETWTVNGVPGRDMPKQPILRVKTGDAVTLGFANASPDLVALSLYGQAIRLLHPADDGWEPYWRDTVLLPPQSRNHVAFIAAKPGRWPIESGFAAQAVAGLRCWFEVRD